MAAAEQVHGRVRVDLYPGLGRRRALRWPFCRRGWHDTVAAPGQRPRPAVRLRWAGLAGATLLAVSSYLAGAGPGAAPASRTEALWGSDAGFRVGLGLYLLGLVVLAVAWWRLGRLAGDLPLRWVLVTGAWWAAPLLVAAPLGSRDIYAYACQGAVWLDGHDPYVTGAAAGDCPWVAAVPEVWQDAASPYGPLALLISAAAVGLARTVAGADGAQLLVAVAALRAAALAGMLLVAGSLPRLARACGVAPAAAAWLGVATPLVGLHALAGGHNDALVAGLVVAALAVAAAGARHRWAVFGAGAAVGLAVAVKVTALVALPFAMLLAAGAARRYRHAGLLAIGAVVAFAGLTLATGLGLGWVAALPGTGAIGQWSSPPTGLGMAVGYGLWGLGWPAAFDPAVAAGRTVGVAGLVVISAALLIRAWRRCGDPRSVAVAAAAALAAVVLLGPVLYPWYALVPLAVLAAVIRAPRARWWLAVATLGLAALVLPSGLGLPVLTRLPGAVLMAAAVAGLSWWWLRHRPRGPRETVA